jgi:hypothetical protein
MALENSPEKDLIKNIAHFFNFDITPMVERRLKTYIEQYAKSKNITPVIIEYPRTIVKYIDRRIMPQPPVVDDKLLDRLASYTCELYEITRDQLMRPKARKANTGKSRKALYVAAREFFVKLAIANSSFSLMEIGKYLGYINHSSVIHLRDGRGKVNINPILENYVRENGYSLKIAG